MNSFRILSSGSRAAPPLSLTPRLPGILSCRKIVYFPPHLDLSLFNPARLGKNARPSGNSHKDKPDPERIRGEDRGPRRLSSGADRLRGRGAAEEDGPGARVHRQRRAAGGGKYPALPRRPPAGSGGAASGTIALRRELLLEQSNDGAAFGIDADGQTALRIDAYGEAAQRLDPNSQSTERHAAHGQASQRDEAECESTDRQDAERQPAERDDSHRHSAGGDAAHGDVADSDDAPCQSTRLMGGEVGTHRD